MDESDFNINSYRRFYSRDESYRDYVNDSYVLSKEDPDKMSKYASFKYNELLTFIENQIKK